VQLQQLKKALNNLQVDFDNNRKVLLDLINTKLHEKDIKIQGTSLKRDLKA